MQQETFLQLLRGFKVLKLQHIIFLLLLLYARKIETWLF